jgi:hypothetical protein
MAAIPVTSGLQLLLDARSITSLSDGDAISAWDDDSGSANNAAQATAGNRPVYKTNIFGSNPAVRTVDSGDFLHGSFASWGTHAGMTVLVCASALPASQTASGRFFTTAAAGQTDTANMLLGDVAGTMQLWVNTANRLPIALNMASAGSTQPVIFGGAYSSSVIDMVINGIWRGNHSYAGGLPSSPTLYSMGYINAGTPSTGFSCLADYHFIIVYNRRLTGSELEQVAYWMREELGMQPAASGGGGARMVNIRGGADQ